MAIRRETLQTIIRFLDQPLSVERRKEKNPPGVYPDRRMRRSHFKQQKPNNFEGWVNITDENIKHGRAIHNAYLEEISFDQAEADRKRYTSQLKNFTELYGEDKAKQIMADQRRRDIVISDKKIML